MKNKTPMRQCIGCREMKSKKEMMRVIKSAEGEIALDVTGKKNGRGAYLCYNSQCLNQAMKSRALERSLKTAISQEIYDELVKEFQTIEQK